MKIEIEPGLWFSLVQDIKYVRKVVAEHLNQAQYTLARHHMLIDANNFSAQTMDILRPIYDLVVAIERKAGQVEALRPNCPFCKNPMELVHKSEGGEEWYFGECENCKMHTPHHTSWVSLHEFTTKFGLKNE